MSGDSRNRIAPARRRHYDDACQSAAEAIVARIHDAAATPCNGCDGHECDDGCQYPGANAAAQRQSDPLRKASYVLSESHLSGYRLVLGFETLAEVQAAHNALAMSSTTRGAP
jgi:hypothetical protein